MNPKACMGDEADDNEAQTCRPFGEDVAQAMQAGHQEHEAVILVLNAGRVADTVKQ